MVSAFKDIPDARMDPSMNLNASGVRVRVCCRPVPVGRRKRLLYIAWDADNEVSSKAGRQRHASWGRQI